MVRENAKPSQSDKIQTKLLHKQGTVQQHCKKKKKVFLSLSGYSLKASVTKCAARLYYGKHVLDYRSTIYICCSFFFLSLPLLVSRVFSIHFFFHFQPRFKELGPQDLSGVPLNTCNNKIISIHATHTINIAMADLVPCRRTKMPKLKRKPVPPGWPVLERLLRVNRNGHNSLRSARQINTTMT